MKLTIKNLSVDLGEKNILRDINLEINSGELHVLMGPNGSGKSTMAQSLMGHPNYKIQSQSRRGRTKIQIDSKNITDLKPEEKAKAGLFLTFQNPIGIPGVSVANLLKVAYASHPGGVKQAQHHPRGGTGFHNPALSVWEFNELLVKECQKLSIPQEFLRRSLNEEFSGGEKKKLEMLQALILQPKFAIFDEIDTGLDVDALKIVAKGIEKLKKLGTGILVITHYQRILKFLPVDRVHILVKGKMVATDGIKLVTEVEKKGYRRWNIQSHHNLND